MKVSCVFQNSIDKLRPQIDYLSHGRTSVIAVLSASGRISWYACGGDDPLLDDLERADAHAAQRLNGDGFAVGVSGLTLREATVLADLVHTEMLKIQKSL